MPCAEITNAITWSKQSTTHKSYPVEAYFTKHFGYGDPYTDSRDTVHYASGRVYAVDTPTPHLKGTLIVAKNSENFGEMVETPRLTYDVEIFPDGTLSYLLKIDGNPVGGLPATKVQATCVNEVLLTAAGNSQVVTVGVSRKPPLDIIT